MSARIPRTRPNTASRLPWHKYAFADPKRVIAQDTAHSAKERRYFCFGRVGEGILTVRFTYRAGVVRIFGAGYWRKGKVIYERENQVQE